MLEQIRYFQAVVRCGSFTEAAAQCHISQSAVSQQVKALERAIGAELLERHNRRFELTAAGEHFYKKSLLLVADYDRLCRETVRMACGDTDGLRIGYLKSYGGQEIQLAVAQFAGQYAGIPVHVMNGSHEDLYDALRTGAVDLVLNDQRRAFSDEYINLTLSTGVCYVELSARSPLAALDSVTAHELRNASCILVCSRMQRSTEQAYYQSVVGLQGPFVFADTLEEARLMVVQGRGFMPVEGGEQLPPAGSTLARIPLYRAGKPVTRQYCAFWRADNSGYYVEAFAGILKAAFTEQR